MMSAEFDPVQIRAAVGEELQTALQLLLENGNQQRTAAACDPRDHFLIAESDQAVAGAVSVREFPAGLSAISTPVCAAGQGGQDLRVRLFRAAFDRCRQRSAAVVVTMSGEDWPQSKSALDRLGFRPSANIAFFHSGLSRVQGNSEWELQAFDKTDRVKLSRVVSETYVDTRDVPALHELLDPAQMLECILSEPGLDPSASGIVCRDGREAGCLFLAKAPEATNCELVYLGLVPSCRGRGWGTSLAEFARERRTTASQATHVNRGSRERARRQSLP